MFTHSSKTNPDKVQQASLDKINKAKKAGASSLPRAVNRDLLMSPQGILQLQRTIGNKAVIQLLKSQLQQRTIGQPVQRMDSEEDEEELQMKQESAMQRVGVCEDEYVKLQVMQMRRLRRADMQTFAETLAGDNSRSTVAVAKDGNDYNIYAQSSLAGMSELIEEYDNVTLRWDQSPGTGYHAEMMALMDHGAGSDIAASQPICKRCNAALSANGVTAINPGDQYTEHWQAPFVENIDENNAFPAKAEDHSRTGLSGRRWGINENNRLYPIAQDIWQGIHPDGW
ncbi:hypothetical protein L9W92_14200 [Pelotomaculum terephthalicicum JT]|uniref:hypothetical protein n=1 Tax=Pelotomaculum TaxID=191373 RepID=UPI0009CF4D1E|nr:MULTISPECIES: hypothetical protein [Pelotomaculum]MCG9969176.1 hypothetical protein [Pelotomaculum terephthalicicum JT]OPX87713.1 MAG: hypothetical protein A4E54_01519 [Pelotomaculum sp. PtaB.Bin117]OPY61614.1 MAG: hypothetical protein A4E56_01915 [Pelotomaculum sp. PtaU1.Bin065]